MKKLLIAILALICQMPAWAQAQAIMPTIIAFPSDLYLNKMGFGKMDQVEGRTQFMQDYDKAFLEDPYLKTALSGVSNALHERGFEVKMLENALRDIKNKAAMRTTNRTSSSNFDEAMNTAKADIRLDVEFYVNQTLGPRKGWTVKVEAFDAYTSEPIANFNSIVDPTSDVPDLVLKKVVAGYIEDFSGKIFNYFKDLRDNGRKVILDFACTENGSLNMEDDEIDGKVMKDYLADWVEERAHNNNSELKDDGEFNQTYQIRIPFFDETGKAMTLNKWSRKLRDDVKGMGIPATVRQQGLGRVVVMLGDK